MLESVHLVVQHRIMLRTQSFRRNSISSLLLYMVHCWINSIGQSLLLHLKLIQTILLAHIGHLIQVLWNRHFCKHFWALFTVSKCSVRVNILITFRKGRFLICGIISISVLMEKIKFRSTLWITAHKRWFGGDLVRISHS